MKFRTGYDIATDLHHGFTLLVGRLLVAFHFNWPHLVWYNRDWALDEAGYIQGMPVYRKTFYFSRTQTILQYSMRNPFGKKYIFPVHQANHFLFLDAQHVFPFFRPQRALASHQTALGLRCSLVLARKGVWWET